MSRRFLRFAALLLLLLPACASARQSGGAKSPVLEAGQGLKMNRGDLEEMRNNSQDKKSRKADIYVVAVSYSIVDSVMYVSDVRKMEDETVNNRLFLIHRQAYENQFSAFVSGGNDETMMTYLHFSEREKEPARYLKHLLKRNSKTNKFEVKRVGEEFSFTRIDGQ